MTDFPIIIAGNVFSIGNPPIEMAFMSERHNRLVPVVPEIGFNKLAGMELTGLRILIVEERRCIPKGIDVVLLNGLKISTDTGIKVLEEKSIRETSLGGVHVKCKPNRIRSGHERINLGFKIGDFRNLGRVIAPLPFRIDPLGVPPGMAQMNPIHIQKGNNIKNTVPAQKPPRTRIFKRFVPEFPASHALK